MTTVHYFNLRAEYSDPKAAWRELTAPCQTHATFADDPVACLETTHGRRVKGTLKTDRRTGYRSCTFQRIVNGWPVTVHASWFEPERIKA